MSKFKFFAIPVIALLFATTAFAQPGGGRGRGGQPGGGFGGQPGGGFGGFQRGGGDSLIDLALREDVGEALEIVGPQKEDIEKLRESSREAMRGMRDKLQGVPREEMFTKIRELMAEANEKAEKELADVLLPPQMTRLKQLQFQRRAGGGASRALSSASVREQLGLSDAQMEDIQKAAEEAQKELAEELQKLRAEAQDKILAVLTPAQRKKWEELSGEPFEFKQEQRQFGGRPGGGPGGPGGPGGQRRGGGRPAAE